MASFLKRGVAPPPRVFGGAGRPAPPLAMRLKISNKGEQMYKIFIFHFAKNVHTAFKLFSLYRKEDYCNPAQRQTWENEMRSASV